MPCATLYDGHIFYMHLTKLLACCWVRGDMFHMPAGATNLFLHPFGLGGRGLGGGDRSLEFRKRVL